MPRKRRADAERSSAAVLDAAARLLSRKPDAGIDEIAAAAGVVRQTVYAHFGSRHGLIAAVIDRITAEVAADLNAVDTTGPPAEALRRWLAASWGVLDRYPVLLGPAAASAPAGDETARHEPVLGALTAILERGRQTGDFDAGPPIGWLLATVVALGHAAAHQVTSGRMGADEAGRAYRESVLRICARP